MTNSEKMPIVYYMSLPLDKVTAMKIYIMLILGNSFKITTAINVNFKQGKYMMKLKIYIGVRKWKCRLIYESVVKICETK